MAWECLSVPLEDLVEVARERNFSCSLLRLMPAEPGPGEAVENKTDLNAVLKIQQSVKH